ncbi:MAG: hypothetical protein KBF49_02990, partial [Flavobacteriales bacterium]|nr:hypothetical protein [Flavobacteriales bacterium]
MKNRINSNAPDLTKDELSAIIKQKPNNKVLGQRLYLHLYNLSDPEKTAIRQAELDSACALKNEQKADKRTAKNEARAAKGKKPRLPKPKTCRKALRTWAREDVGEPPTILDSALTQRSADQLKLYMTKEGYFNAAVYDTVY